MLARINYHQRVVPSRNSRACLLLRGSALPRKSHCKYMRPNTLSFGRTNVLPGVRGWCSGNGAQRSRAVHLPVQAVLTSERAVTVSDKEFTSSNGSKIQATCAQGPDGTQMITLRTNLSAGRLLLHWGVEGGKGYKGGWRLPDASQRPEGTVQYKDRALQTPFRGTGKGDEKAVSIQLSGDEVSDILNFVLKDDATNTWYDHYGSNFILPLQPSKKHGPPAVAVPELPKQLCDTWAWIKWDALGRPNRSEKQAQDEYDHAIHEMERLLKAGRTLDELWKVARGEILYIDYKNNVIEAALGAKPVPIIPEQLVSLKSYDMWEHAGQPKDADFIPAAQDALEAELRQGRTLEDLEQELSKKLPAIPDELVALKAYVMWEKAGKPQGADFGFAARQEIEKQLQAGTGLQEIEDELRAPKDKPARAPSPPTIPHELIISKAHSMWEEAGKPMGANFDGKARAWIEEQVRGGKSLEQVEEEVTRARKKGAPAPAPAQAQAPAPAPASAPAPPRSPSPGVQVGRSQFTTGRDPLHLIKKPMLSSEKTLKVEKPLDFLVQRAAVDDTTVWRRIYPLGSKSELLVVVRQPQGDEGPALINLYTDIASPMVLHWGVCMPGSRDWKRGPAVLRPDGTKVLEGGVACETSFLDCHTDECDIEIMGAKVPLQRIAFTVPSDQTHELSSITFVMRSADGTRWYRDANGNFIIPIPAKYREEEVAAAAGQLPPEAQDEVSSAILDCELNAFHWTLMHRFNKAADLLNDVLDHKVSLEPQEATARIFVWLRYSATRQLTWQRNYNTQPRILSAAQDRLTHKITEAHAALSGEAQDWVRMMVTTVGRGGDGQKIRDEILHIMHRNHIPEMKGLWIEEWHQKLHNNTTPDDVPICQAYIAFLEANGDLGAYWRKLSDAGISRERLASYDRAITTEPQYYPDKRDALLKDMRNYLGILKAVHSGADLQASAAAVGNRLPAAAKGYLGYVLSHLGDSQILPFMEAAVEARTELAPALCGHRDMLYLDLALENVVRQAAERAVGAAGFGAAAFMQPLLQNLCLTLGDNEELCFCLKAWQSLPSSVRSGGRPSHDEALQAVAVVNRIRRALGEVSDNIVNRLQPIATAYGQALKCEPWAVDLFAEEVVRGSAAFAVSLVITSIEAGLRAAAELGAWQVISPHEVVGLVEFEESLHPVQDKVYEQPTVLVVNNVSGEEEIPEGVVAVLTPDAPDVLSHVSVRARNMKVLFATCHDEEPLAQIKAAKGKWLHFSTTAAGAVVWNEVHGKSAGASAGGLDDHNQSASPHNLVITIPKWSGRWVVGMDDYKDGVVGAKSKNLAGLRGKLPDWVKLPPSVTVPFGCFEQALEEPENHGIRNQLATLVERIHKMGKSSGTQNGNGISEGPAALLAECRRLAMEVHVPKVLREQLAQNMQNAGIPVPENEGRWELALKALKGVWASKYNDRAFYSLKKVGLNFDDVRMAVLVQRVVPAQYAFVIHTKNPSNNDDGEVFCELVKGLGESLVSGTVPGSSVAFVARKNNLDNVETLSYASKSEGMFVRDSLIFRSDSNGEDLEGYAGAGLYESITMDPTETLKIDYMDDKLVQDGGYRKHILSNICKVGYAIETALGSAQDIEGVVAPDNSITVVQTRPQV